jgi:hypothetical protein
VAATSVRVPRMRVVSGGAVPDAHLPGMNLGDLAHFDLKPPQSGLSKAS